MKGGRSSDLAISALIIANALILAAMVFATLVLLAALDRFGSQGYTDLLLCGIGLILAMVHSFCLIRLADGDRAMANRTVLLALIPLPSLAFTVLVFSGPA